jgi:type II secretory pathway component GspD/PulD (secretin)
MKYKILLISLYIIKIYSTSQIIRSTDMPKDHEELLYESIPIVDLDKGLETTITRFWNHLVKNKNNSKKILLVNHELQSAIIKASKNEILELKNLIKAINIPQTKVKIDIVLIATQNQFDIATGINWSGIYNRLKSVQESKENFDFVGMGGNLESIPVPTFPMSPIFGNLFVNPNVFTINTFSPPISTKFGQAVHTEGTFLRSTNNLTLPIVFGGPDLNLRRLNLVLNANEVENNITVISRPSILTSNNKIAKMLTADSLPFYNTIQQTIQSSQNLRNTNSFDYRDIGISIQVKPMVHNDKNHITLDFFIEFTEITSGSTTISGFSGVMFDPPNLLFGKIKDKVMLQNGQTIIVSGISNRKHHNEITNVPYLNKIPGGNKLFTSQGKEKRMRDDFLFITATIVE